MEADNNISLLVFDFFQMDKIFLFIFLVVCIIVAVKVVNYWSGNVQMRFSGKRLAILQITTIFSFSAYLFGILLVFYYVFQPSKELLVGIGGSAAVAIGFALKDLVGSIIAGFILLFDRPFQVGDRVEFDGNYGEIKSIGLRSVRLNTLDDNLVTIPNSKFLTDSVSSGNSGALDMMVVSTFYVSLFENLSKVKKLLHEVVITSRFAYLEKNFFIVFEEVAISNTFVIRAELKAYVIDVKYEKAFLTDVTSRAEAVFRRHSIQRPIMALEIKE